MKTIYLKELKAYLNSIITYVFFTILIIVYATTFMGNVFYNINYAIGMINYEGATYLLFSWVAFLIPILIFLSYRSNTKKRMDTNLYTSTVSSLNILIGKVLAVTTTFLIPFGIIFIINILLKLFVYKTSAMVLSIFIPIVLVLINLALFSIINFTLIKRPLIALITNIIVEVLLSLFLLIFTNIQGVVFMDYLRGLIPLAPTLFLIVLFVFQLANAIYILDKKRNVI